MDIFDKIARVTKVALNEINKPDTFVKGDAFEGYVRTQLFVKERYELLNKTHDYTTNKDDYIENTKEPDFRFRSIKTGHEFLVEAKFRSAYYDNAIEWCKLFQLKRYKAIDKTTPVYIILGVGKECDAPGEIFLIPLKDIKYTKLFRSFLKDYEIPSSSPVDHRLLK
jgi:hypothetical protein